MLRIFLSFRGEDRPAREELGRVVGAAMGVRFEDYPVNESSGEGWQSHCATLIANTAGTIVLIGRNTWDSDAIRWEIKTATGLDRRVLGIRLPAGPPEPPVEARALHVVEWDFELIGKELESWIHATSPATTSTTSPYLSGTR